MVVETKYLPETQIMKATDQFPSGVLKREVPESLKERWTGRLLRPPPGLPDTVV